MVWKTICFRWFHTGWKSNETNKTPNHPFRLISLGLKKSSTGCLYCLCRHGVIEAWSWSLLQWLRLLRMDRDLLSTVANVYVLCNIIDNYGKMLALNRISRNSDLFNSNTNFDTFRYTFLLKMGFKRLRNALHEIYGCLSPKSVFRAVRCLFWYQIAFYAALGKCWLETAFHAFRVWKTRFRKFCYILLDCQG